MLINFVKSFMKSLVIVYSTLFTVGFVYGLTKSILEDVSE